MWVSATGLVCPVGLSAQAACLAMRAELSSNSELPYKGINGKPIVGASVELLPFDMARSDRLLSLLTRALIDCVVKAGDIVLEQTPLMVVLPQGGAPGACVELEGTRIFDALEQNLGWTFEKSLSRVFSQGVTGTAHAIGEAVQAAARTQVGASLVCAVDSLLDARVILEFENDGRLMSEDRSDGIIPGEAAACVYLTRRHSPRRIVRKS